MGGYSSILKHKLATRLLSIVMLVFLLGSSSGSAPVHDWPAATPESQGIDSEQVAAAIEMAREKLPGIHSLLIVRNGALVTEAYFHPYDGKSPHDVASVTKGITTTLAGIAISKGKLGSPQDGLLGMFPGRFIANHEERKDRIRLEHLMTMSSGLDCKAARGEPTLWEMLGAPDNVRHMLDLPMVAEPGANFVYCSGGMHLLSAVIERATGMKTEAFARQNLFEPLGIHTLIWPADPQGVSHGFGNLHLLPRDMAKLGWLFLNGGAWGDHQIVPAEWIAAATRMQKTTGNARDYGYGWWIPKGDSLIAYEASGRGGQQISVLPAKKTVIVMTGGGFATGEVMKLLLPALRSEEALPENPAALARLQAAIAAVARPRIAATAPVVSTRAGKVSGKTYVLDSNWMGLQQVTLTFSSRRAAMARFRFGPSLKQFQFGRAAKLQGNATVNESRPVGLAGTPILSPSGMMGLPVAVSGFWEDPQTFVLEYDEVANTNCYRLRLSFEGEMVKVQAKERTGLFDESFAGKVMRAGRRR